MGESAHNLLLAIAWGLLLVFTGLAVVGVIALVGIRAARQATSRRRQRDRGAIRSRIVAAIVDEGDAAAEADRELMALRGTAWDHAEAAVIAMLPKVRGDAQERLRTVLRTRGTEQRALAQARSLRAFVRCKGAFALGVLRSTDAVDRLIVLLDDRSALVRRVAVRSLGQIGDARAVEPLLALAARDLGLTRDIVFALHEIGLSGAPALRAAVGSWQPDFRADDRPAALAASALGMIQDVDASLVLADAVLRGPIALRLAAAKALGHLDTPLSLAPLQAALRAPSHQVRVAAAASLGRLGAEVAIPALVDVMRSTDSATARAAADALMELGPAGRAALESSGAPHAIEALALHRLRSG
jgi:HEAT repeat protein